MPSLCNPCISPLPDVAVFTRVGQAGPGGVRSEGDIKYHDREHEMPTICPIIAHQQVRSIVNCIVPCLHGKWLFPFSFFLMLRLLTFHSGLITLVIGVCSYNKVHQTSSTVYCYIIGHPKRPYVLWQCQQGIWGPSHRSEPGLGCSTVQEHAMALVFTGDLFWTPRLSLGISPNLDFGPKEGYRGGKGSGRQDIQGAASPLVCSAQSKGWGEASRQTIAPNKDGSAWFNQICVWGLLSAVLLSTKQQRWTKYWRNLKNQNDGKKKHFFFFLSSVI